MAASQWFGAVSHQKEEHIIQAKIEPTRDDDEIIHAHVNPNFHTQQRHTLEQNNAKPNITMVVVMDLLAQYTAV